MVLSRKNEDKDLHSPYEISRKIGNDIGSLFASVTKNGAGTTVGAVVAAAAPECFGTVSINILNRKGVAMVVNFPRNMKMIDRTTRHRIPNAYCRSI